MTVFLSVQLCADTSAVHTSSLEKPEASVAAVSPHKMPFLAEGTDRQQQCKEAEAGLGERVQEQLAGI